MPRFQRWKTLGAHASEISCLAYSPTGETIACGYDDGAVTLWEISSGRALIQYSHPKDATAYYHRISAIAFSPDGTLLASTNHALASGARKLAVKVWVVATGEVRYVLEGGNRGLLHTVAFSPDGKLLAVGGDMEQVRFYEVATGQESGLHLPPFRSSVSVLAFTPDGKTLIVGCDGSLISLWDLAQERALYQLRGHRDWTTTLALDPEGQFFVSGGEDGFLKVWNVEHGRLQADLPEQVAVQMPPGMAAWVFSVTMSPDGKWLASTGENGRITLWDVATWQTVAQAHHQDKGVEVFFSPNGTPLPENERVLLYKDIVMEVAFSPDGTTLASGGHDRILQLWHIDE